MGKPRAKVVGRPPAKKRPSAPSPVVQPPRLEDRSDPIRVVVFIDWMNAYHRGYELLGRGVPDGPVRPPMYDPVKLGEWVAQNNDDYRHRRKLCGVRVYQGVAVQRYGSAEYAKYREATNRFEAWGNKYGDLVTVSRHNLKYDDRGFSREKGVDVQLAVDVMRMTLRDELDVAVLVSQDSDFVPVVSALSTTHPNTAFPAIETVRWYGLPWLNVPGCSPRYHTIDRSVFDEIRDDTDYAALDASSLRRAG